MEPKQETHEPDREIVYPEKVLKQKVSKSPTLETIVEEDDIQSGRVSITSETISKVENSKEQVSHKEISVPVTQIAQAEAVIPVKKQLVKFLVPQKSQSACKKPKIAPKPTPETYSQAEEQYGKNVAGKKQFFESLSSNINPKSKVKGKVERLVEKFESKNQEVAAGRSR